MERLLCCASSGHKGGTQLRGSRPANERNLDRPRTNPASHLTIYVGTYTHKEGVSQFVEHLRSPYLRSYQKGKLTEPRVISQLSPIFATT